MVERGGFPILFAMAGLAFLAKDPLMIVVFLMAGVAVNGSGFVTLIWMAIFAFRVDVFAPQWEYGFSMVERGCLFPVLLGMTGFAGSSECAFVLIVFVVAGIATGRRFLFGQRHFVTAFAFRGFVLAQERVLGVLVVVERGCSPILFAMAGFAFLAKDAFVIVILLMTGHAISLEFILVEMAGMTAFTLGGFVLVP